MNLLWSQTEREGKSINITHNATTIDRICFFKTLCQVFSYFSRDFKGM